MKRANSLNNSELSFRAEEPPPDPSDFETQEEEQANRLLLQRLYEQQKKHREFVYQMELERKIKQEKAEEQRKKELIAQKAYFERRNASAKYRAMANNERIRQMLNKVDEYMQKIEKIEPIDKVKQQANKEMLEEIKKSKRKVTKEQIENISKLNKKNTLLREENKEKIKQRKDDEEMKRKRLDKLKRANDRANNILEHGFKNVEKDDCKIAGLFMEEKPIIGDNMLPMQENKIKRKVTVNENADVQAEYELRQILKTDPHNMKKLLAFKKKYKFFDVSSYLHTAKMQQIREAKVVRVKNEGKNAFLNNDELNFENANYPDYLTACKYNNHEYIEAFLLKAKNDVEVFTMVNLKDKYERNGLMYLIIHNNINMIKLTLLSGVILNVSDIFGRNLVHYCCTQNVDAKLLDIICHCIDFKDYKDMSKYIEKVIKIEHFDEDTTYDSDEYRNECLKRIEEFDSLVENKDKILELKGLKNTPSEGQKTNKEEKKLGYNRPYKIDKPLEDPYENIRRKDISISKLVNSADVDGNYPMHYLAQQDDLDKMEVLIYFHAKLNVFDQQGNKPINLTSNEVIQQFLLKNEENSIAKKGGVTNNNFESSRVNLSNRSIFKQNNLNNSSMSILDMDKLRYYTVEQINSFTTGVESNNYLILSVEQKNYDLFRFLIQEKNAKIDYINGNGFTVLSKIFSKKLWAFLSFIFGLKAENPKAIYEELSQIGTFEKTQIIKGNGEYTPLGAALKVLDTVSNKHNNLLTICIDDLNDIYVLKFLILLYQNYITFFGSTKPADAAFIKQYGKYDDSSQINIIFNRAYGKSKETLLIKIVKKQNLDMLKYMMDELFRENNILDLDVYKTDVNNQNILHHAIRLKNKKIIKYLIKYDTDNNILRDSPDNKNKKPADYDLPNAFKYDCLSIYDAVVMNDIDLLQKIFEEKYYSINEQKFLSKNTPLHIAAQHKADKAALFLVKHNCDPKIKNKNNQNAWEYLNHLKSRIKMDLKEEKLTDKWLSKFGKILENKINDYIDLDRSVINKTDTNNKSVSKILVGNRNSMGIPLKNENKNKVKKLSEGICHNKKLRDILIAIKDKFENENVDIEVLFKKLDANNDGKLSPKEFDGVIKHLNIPEFTAEHSYLLRQYLDSDDNGFVEYEEFLELMKP